MLNFDLTPAVQASQNSSLGRALMEGLANAHQIAQNQLNVHNQKILSQFTQPMAESQLDLLRNNAAHVGLENALMPKEFALKQAAMALRKAELQNAMRNGLVGGRQILNTPYGYVVYDKATGRTEPIKDPFSSAPQGGLAGALASGESPINPPSNPLGTMGQQGVLSSPSALSLMSKISSKFMRDPQTGQMIPALTVGAKTQVQKNILNERNLENQLKDYLASVEPALPNLLTSGALDTLGRAVNMPSLIPQARKNYDVAIQTKLPLLVDTFLSTFNLPKTNESIDMLRDALKARKGDDASTIQNRINTAINNLKAKSNVIEKANALGGIIPQMQEKSTNVPSTQDVMNMSKEQLKAFLGE